MIDKITQLLLLSIAGDEIENPKVDFKSKWYALGTKPGINEFLKDTTSIANTVGLDGYIIIGYDERSKTVIGTEFKDSELRDTSDLPYLIIKHCSDLFDINYSEINFQGKRIGVLHIPPVLHKPILIKRYQSFNKKGEIKKEIEQRIFVRKGTSTFPANKNDIELMYYDRKNVILDFSYSVDIISFKFRRKTYVPVSGKEEVFIYHCDLSFVFENSGTRAISIKNYTLIASKQKEEIHFVYIVDMIKFNNRERTDFVADVYAPGQVATKLIRLGSNNIGKLIDDNYFGSYKLIMETSKGKTIIAEFIRG